MFRTVSLVALVALAVLAGAGCADAREGAAAAAVASPTSEPAWAIQGHGPGGAIIEVVAADGSGRVPVAAGVPGADQTNPDWSPDGRALTFVTGEGGQDDLWTVGVDGTGARRVYDCAGRCDYVDDPAWAPAGASIAVCEMRTSGKRHLGSLVSVDVATGTPTTLATFAPKDFCAGPRWSPDGRSVVLEVVHRDGTGPQSEVTGVTLSRIDLTRKHPAVVGLTDPALFAATADWNDAGDLIVYSALATPDAAGPELFTIRPDGTDRRRLTSVVAGGGTAEEPSFDRDGTGVVFVHGGQPELARVDLATRTVAPAFATGVAARQPARAPPASAPPLSGRRRERHPDNDFLARCGNLHLRTATVGVSCARTCLTVMCQDIADT